MSKQRRKATRDCFSKNQQGSRNYRIMNGFESERTTDLDLLPVEDGDYVLCN